MDDLRSLLSFTAMPQSVGDIAELRQLIFSFADFGDIVRCSRVSRAWNDDTLSIVWRALPSPRHLLALVDEDSLCPTMTWRHGEGHATISKPAPWARFRAIVRHVREMTFPTSNRHQQLLEKLALLKALCPYSPLLPNLEQVTVLPCSQIVWVPVVALFLHTGVRQLEILPPEEDGPSFFTYPDFFREVLLRAPLLEGLKIGECNLLTFARVWRDEDAAILARYATQFQHLTRFSAPPCVIANLTHTVTSLPNLRTLHEIPALRPRAASRDCSDWWTTNRFGSNIEDLAFTAALVPYATQLFRRHMPHLRILHLEARMDTRVPQDMPQFLHALSTRCPVLEELTIQCIGMLGLTGRVIMRESIDISEFALLAECTSLSVLELRGPCALTTDDGDADVQLVAILPPHLRVCKLAFVPLSGPLTEPRTPLPSLGALAHIASRCRQLQELGVVLDPVVPNAHTATPAVRFNPGFQKLSIGHYVGARGWHAPAVARYLATLLPRRCSVGILPSPRWRSNQWKEQTEVTQGEERLKQAFELVTTYLS
ncbi:hypothetical protein C8R45DRAFT_1020091 [Mycena sanguinolenta]|nr:hypothetical protein C8R45DRAFT_1020091 [Mycena sanguinolenta]